MTTLTPFHQFIQQKHEEARRAAPHADVRLVPEAEGYAVYGSGKELQQFVPLDYVHPLIKKLTSTGRSVALLDKARLSAHGGWRLVLIAEIPAIGVKEAPKEDEDFA